MLVLATAWTALLAASLIVGSALVRATGEARWRDTADRVLLALWLGSLVIVSALTAVSLFAPLGSAISVGAVIVLIGVALVIPSVRASLQELAHSLKLWSVAGLAVLMLGVAYYVSSQPVSWSDTGGYHAGAIQWLTDYGAVKGIALLEFRLGFASSWFSLAAAFNVGPLAGHIEALTGGYALLLASAHFVASLTRVGRSEGRLSDWFAAIAYLVALTWIVRTGIAISPSPDLPVILLVIFVAWSLLLLRESGPEIRRSDTLLPPEAFPLILATGATSIKLSAAPLLAIAVVFLVMRERSKPRLIASFGVAALIALPTIVLSLVLSGCPFFPAPVLCVTQSWSVGGLAASHDAAIARDFLRWSGSVPANGNSLNWLPHWVRSEPLAALAILYASIALVCLLIPPVRTNDAKLITLVGVLGIAYVMLFSPTYRFLLGYAVIPPSYVAAWLFTRYRIHPLALVPPTFLALGSIGLVTLTDYHSDHLTSSARWFALILPATAVSALTASALQASSGWLGRQTSNMNLSGAITAGVVGLVFAISTLGLIPNSRPLPRPGSTSAYLNALLFPLAVPTAAVVTHTINDFEYFSPVDSLGNCWAIIPCTPETVPSTLHLLDPRKGLSGGLGF